MQGYGFKVKTIEKYELPELSVKRLIEGRHGINIPIAAVVFASPAQSLGQ